MADTARIPDANRITEPYSRPNKSSWTKIAGRVGFWLLIIFIVLYTLFPFYWAVASSLTPANDLFKSPVPLFPERLTLDHYRVVFGDSSFLRAILNSAIVSFSVVILALL